MKGSEQRLAAYMQGSNKRFVIPVYQRNYDWKIENCKQLYDDLIKVIHKQRKSHFFGSIVEVFNPDADGSNSEFLIIDGQQRLTTISLLFLAMYNLMTKNLITSVQPNLRQRILEEYLVDKWQDEDTRIKLKPVKNDQVAYGKLFTNVSDYIPESCLTINYNYFYDRIQKEEVTIDELFEAICRLEIISITLNQDDNPQLIFESLNSTGLALSEGDKIRNFILMGLSTRDQNRFYETYWNQIELYTDYDVSSFIRDYLSVKQQAIPSQNKIYFMFKAYVEEHEFDTQMLLKELFSYAKWYRYLLKGETANQQLNGCIYRLNRLETSITRPFFLEVMRLQAEGMLEWAEAAEIFLVTENYLFRRTICELPTNALNKIFLLLHKEIIRYDGREDNYVAKFKYALSSKKERTRFPEDTEFVQAFAQRPVYLMTSKNKLYILERLENYGTREDKDVYRHVDAGEYSIEHIMPQHLTPAWVKGIGPDYMQIHEQWLHRIANLTLTAYNSKYSNNPFSEKKEMKHGYRESGIRMNSYIAQWDNWGLPELEARTQHLMERALEIWTSPMTNYVPDEKQLDSVTLDDEINLSGRLIASFSYKGIEQPVNSWIEMYEQVLKILHEEDKSILSRLAYTTDDSSDLTTYISNDKTTLRAYFEIEEGMYAERNTSTEFKLSLLRRFFKLYHVEPAELVFYLRDENEDELTETTELRYELRKRYWAYALNLIQSAHGHDGSFCNVKPSKDNWINGFFGISGFSICCVANYDSARVEIYMGKANKEVNKAAFDYLLAHRCNIEAALGVELIWARNDDSKSSKVYYQLDNVGINNETDWGQMAKFHGEWSKRFDDVIVPFLKQM